MDAQNEHLWKAAKWLQYRIIRLDSRIGAVADGPGCRGLGDVACRPDRDG
jgi:hypothetical protein